MKTYEIPVSWETYGTIKIKATSLQKALVKAFSPEQSLPDNGDYIDDSFKVDNDDGEILSLNYPKESFDIEEAKKNG